MTRATAGKASEDTTTSGVADAQPSLGTAAERPTIEGRDDYTAATKLATNADTIPSFGQSTQRHG